MPYIVVLQRDYGRYEGLGSAYAKALTAKDLDCAIKRAEELAKREPRDGATFVNVIAVFDALAGAIGEEVEKDYD